jgi:hypothetical protein
MANNSDCFSVQYSASVASLGIKLLNDLLQFSDQHEHLLNGDLGIKKVYDLSLRLQTITAELNLLASTANELVETLDNCQCKRCLQKQVCYFITTFSSFSNHLSFSTQLLSQFSLLFQLIQNGIAYHLPSSNQACTNSPVTPPNKPSFSSITVRTKTKTLKSSPPTEQPPPLIDLTQEPTIIYLD